MATCDECSATIRRSRTVRLCRECAMLSRAVNIGIATAMGILELAFRPDARTLTIDLPVVRDHRRMN